MLELTWYGFLWTYTKLYKCVELLDFKSVKYVPHGHGVLVPRTSTINFGTW